MRIAILGATSQISKDLVTSFSACGTDELHLFARRTDAVKDWLTGAGLSGRHVAADFEAFSINERFDAVINFVGVGNPAQAVKMGASILDVTQKFDDLALNYVRYHRDCRYLFVSSGAAYGTNFDEPVAEDSHAIVAITASCHRIGTRSRNCTLNVVTVRIQTYRLSMSAFLVTLAAHRISRLDF
jgi:nucleoside-diphosphate-sugar epimerase